MRILSILLILILAVGAGYAQTPENMKLRVKVIDAEGKPIPKDAVDRFHILDMSDEPMYTLIVPHDGSVTVVLPTPEKSRPRRLQSAVSSQPLATVREGVGLPPAEPDGELNSPVSAPCRSTTPARTLADSSGSPQSAVCSPF